MEKLERIITNYCTVYLYQVYACCKHNVKVMIVNALIISNYGISHFTTISFYFVFLNSFLGREDQFGS